MRMLPLYLTCWLKQRNAFGVLSQELKINIINKQLGMLYCMNPSIGQ